MLPDQPDIPPSLQNIYKEIHEDVGCDIPNNGYLKKWADQGVLMLNTVLTVRAHQANSHQGKGWDINTFSMFLYIFNLPVYWLKPVFFKEFICLAEMLAPKEPSECRGM